MELTYDATPGKYVEYCIATQGSWKIYNLDSRVRYTQIFNAIAGSTRLKILELRCDLHGGLVDADLFKFAAAIESNNTLERLCLRGQQNAPHGMAAVFNALATKPKIRSFDFNNGAELEPVAWAALLDFLRTNTKLKDLSLYNSGLAEGQIIELMEVLKDHNGLMSLDLAGENNSASLESLKAIARFVASSSTIQTLEVNEELTSETAPQILDIMQHNTSLINAKPYNGFIAKSEFLERNFKVYDATREERKFHYPVESQPDQILLPDVTHTPAIMDLSSDILRLIFWQLGVKSLCTMRRVNKLYHTFTKHGPFWRGYYMAHFPVIPGDVLSLTDLTYGLKLAADPSTQSSVWEELVINSFRARQVSNEKFPVKLGLPFMEKVFRQFPQLIGSIHSESSLSVFPPERTFFKTKEAPYAYTWFLLYAKGSAVYHMGFEQLHDGQYNGILFFTPDFSTSWDRRFDYMLYVFEWFAATNEAEFAEKCKPLCEVFLNARHTNHLDYVNAPFSNKVPQLLEEAVQARHKCIEFLNAKIDTEARDYCAANMLDGKSTEFVCKVEELIERLKGFADIPDLEVERLRQQIPARSILNTKYPLPDNVQFLHDFKTHEWDVPTTEVRSYAVAKHRKHAKSMPFVAVMKLYRVTMNVLLMPVLKTFWPGDIDHPDYELYPFLRRNIQSLALFRKLYYSGSYRPFEHVSNSNAPPSHWPLIALGLARQVLPLVVLALNDRLDEFNNNAGRKSNKNNNVDQLIDLLDKMSLVTPSMRSFLQILFAL